MQTVEHEFSCQNEIKKSTFIAHIVPINSFDSLHVKLKEKYPKARHIVWAKRYFNEFEQVVENCSDDGEPKGTSGPPLLNVMRGSELIECGILVVRFFGGIKLGTGGLVRAYGGGAKDVIAAAQIIPYIKREEIVFSTTYSLVPRFEHFINKEALHVKSKSYEASRIIWSLHVSKVEEKTFLAFSSLFERDGFKALSPLHQL